MHDLLFALWFFTPAGLATLAPVLAAMAPGLKAWNTPIDFGRSFRGKRILGDNKTWRGVVVATALGTAWFAIQILIYQNSEFVRSFSQFDYTREYAILIGLGLSFGAIFGDAVSSFFKRQLEIEPGKAWIPFDQIDYIIGGLVLSLPFVLLSLPTYSLIFVVWTVVHVAFGFIGYVLKINADPI